MKEANRIAGLELKLLIGEVLEDIFPPYTRNVEQLLMLTSGHEGHFVLRTQTGGGPALGVYQMEPATFNDIVVNVLAYKQDLKRKIQAYCGTPIFDPNMLQNNDKLATCFTRLQYLRFPEPIPMFNDIENMWKLYKLRYNTPLGKATKEEFMNNYEVYVKPLYL